MVYNAINSFHGGETMKKRQRKYILNHILRAILRLPFELIFRFTHENFKLDEPTLVICNHVTNFDVILASLCCPGYHMHFVASEHMFRKGLISAFLRFVFDPICRRKGVSGADTAMACLRTLRGGKSVFIFAEGETSWDGRSQDIVASTGRLAQISGARLLTYRLEGGYLTAPRWGKGIRRGRMQGRVVNIYSPQQLKAMSKEAVTEQIRRDIYEDAWQRQAEDPVAYQGRRRAEKMEAVLFLCPQCGRAGTLKSRRNTLSCSCGLQAQVTPYGNFADDQPFQNLAHWDAWQRQKLENMLSLGHAPVFSDEDISLYRIHEEDHGQDLLCCGTLTLENGVLRIGSQQIPLESISGMSLVMGNAMVFYADGCYLELRARQKMCMRKYLLVWKHILDETHKDALASGGHSK